MEQTVAVPEVDTNPEPQPTPVRNDRALVASVLGIVGAVLVAGVLGLAAVAVITAITTPDFMPDDITNDPFVGAGLASVLPLIVGFIGVGYSIGALAVVSVRGGKARAILGLVLGILNVLLPIVVGVLMVFFDQQVAACGGG